MNTTKATEVRPSAFERTDRVGSKVTRNRSVEPQRLELVSIQQRVRPGTAREGFDLPTAEASLFWTSLEGQQPLIAQVDDMLARRSQDRGGIASADQIAIGHAAMMPKNHKKHNTWPGPTAGSFGSNTVPTGQRLPRLTPSSSSEV
jgi:hypothetical protein